jgi:soluble lytic murein transglycosylase-like protein
MRGTHIRSTVLTAALLILCLAAEAATTERPDDALRALLIKAISESNSFADRFDAEVWLTDMSGRLSEVVVDSEERIEILRRVHQEASRSNLDPELVLAVIHVESNFDRFAISRAGAQGLMQIMPFWLDEIGRPGDNLFHIRTNLKLGCAILRYYLEKEKGHLSRALARYNGSVGQTWYPRRVFKALRTRWY